MKILAMDSSGLVASVALLEDSIMVAEYTIHYKKTHSQTLLPMIDEIAKMAELDLKTIDAIAIARGPGSFTGLRIGAGTAKGLGLALGVPIVPVSTLEGLAYHGSMFNGLICPIMDARRNQVYTGIYKCINEELHIVADEAAMGIVELISKLEELNQNVIFVGDGIPVYQNVIEQNLRCDFEFAPPHVRYQLAGAVAVLGKQYYQQGRTVSAAEFIPEYLRLSQAERERAEKHND